MTFKEKIVKLRKQKGLTQDDFASAVGVSRQAVYKWESGQSYPEAQKLLEIKKLFDISIDDLLDDNFEVIVPEKKKRKRLPKEVKAEVEAEVVAPYEPLEDEPAAEAPDIEELAEVKEPVIEAEVKEEPVIEATVEEEPEVQEAPAVSESDENDSDEPKKKVGFFGRIFGRK